MKFFKMTNKIKSNPEVENPPEESTLAVTEENITEFLKSETERVLAIKGAWGIGKTFFWKRYWEKQELLKMGKLKNYSYISLFGVKNINDLKRKILINKVPENYCPAIIDLAKSTGSKYTMMPAQFLENIMLSSIKQTIICIDDLERKGKKLELREILGVVSELVEEKQCKIIIIFNEDKLDKSSPAEYALFREKVIEKEIEYKPTSSDCFEIACMKIFSKEHYSIYKSIPLHNTVFAEEFKNESSKQLDLFLLNYINELKEIIVNLNIRNIRIICKIIMLFLYLAKRIFSYKEVKENFKSLLFLNFFNDLIKIICVCMHCYLDKGRGIPPLSFISKNEFEFSHELNKVSIKKKQISISDLATQDLDFNDNANQKQENAEIISRKKQDYLNYLGKNSYPFHARHHKEIENIVTKVIRGKIICERKFKKSLMHVISECVYLRGIENMRFLRNHYYRNLMRIHSCFDHDSLVLKKLYNASVKAISIVALDDIFQTISILKKCSDANYAENLLKLLLEKRKDLLSQLSKSDIDGLKKYSFGKWFIDAILDLQNNINYGETKLDLKDAIKKAGEALGANNNLSSDATETLINSTVDDYCNCIKNYRSISTLKSIPFSSSETDLFYAGISSIIKYGSILTSGENNPSLIIKKALQKIGRESKLNKIRVSKFFT